MKKTILDPAGNPLKSVLLQVVDKDANGPLTLRVRQDTDTIDLANDKHRTFFIVWVSADQEMGEVFLNDLHNNLLEIQALMARREQEKAQLDIDINILQKSLADIQEENKTKTEALRQLQRERDPERNAFIIAEAVKTQTASLEESVRARNKTIADLERQNEELRVSKRRLKEANERLKDGRK